MQKTLLTAIWLYQTFISPFLPASCRFNPSCSCYAHEAIQTYGTLAGTRLGIKRLCRCHPFCGGGYDPVPKKEGEKEWK